MVGDAQINIPELFKGFYANTKNTLSNIVPVIETI